MSYSSDYEHATNDLFAIDAAQEERVAFIRRTYLHLVGAILAFIGLTAVFLETPAIVGAMMQVMLTGWWLVLISFFLVSWVAQRWAHSDTSLGVQYAGLALYTVAEALIFVPILFMATHFGGPDIIPMAGFLTMFIFVGLTIVVFATKTDFSFIRSALWLGSIAAMGVMIASAFLGFSLGLVFTAAMIVLMSGFILYDTSNILHHYRTDQHVGAALALFASVATLFWYVIRLVMMLGGDD